jgi:tRNA-2-methylthio-N6-dimethylallyladenosine synthase
MASTHNVMPQLHMPLQSGSDAILKSMRRSYRSDKYLGIIDKVRAAMPDAAITTDIIVGFPDETEEDFQATMDVVRQARFANAFTFQYSQRPGTPAATMENQVPAEIVQDRYERLVKLGNDVAWDENKKLVGQRVELLVAEGEGKKDDLTTRMSGRARDSRLVHFGVTGEVVASGRPRPGDIVEVELTYAAPHHHNADAGVLSWRQTPAGDIWESSRTSPAGESGVLLGMPSLPN